MARESVITSSITNYNTLLSQESPLVVMQLRGKSSLYLRSTLPNKDCPGSSRQRIALSDLSATPEGLAMAFKKACELQTQLRTNTFEWWRWPSKSDLAALKEVKQTLEELIPALEDHYFHTRERTSTKLDTWKRSYLIFYRAYLKKNTSVPTPNILEKFIRERYPIDSRNRENAKIAFIFLGKYLKWANFGLEQISSIECSYKAGVRSLEDFGSLVKIADGLKGKVAINYKLMLVYGLRPHELFLIDPVSLDPKYKGVISVKEGGKSRAGRLAMPVHAGLYERWQMWTFADKLPTSKARTLGRQGALVGRQFRRAGITFPAYNLRHSAAAKFRGRGIHSDIASRSMGHSAETHRSVYLRWMDVDYEREVLDQLSAANPDRDDFNNLPPLPEHLIPKPPRTSKTPKK